jgi:RimJ/RimL family protein N-acetyltransferase
MRIRKLSLNDSKNLQKLFLNEKNLKDTGMNVTKGKITSKFMKKWLTENIKQYKIKKPTFVVYAISKRFNRIIGTIGIGNIDYKSKSGSIGYWISKKYSGRGYCTKAIKRFIERFLKKRDIKTLFAEVSNKNISSYKVLKKNRFEIIKKSKENLFLKKVLSNH